MFEAEEQLEEKPFNYNFLIIFLIIVAIAAGAVYFLMRSQKDLTPEQATVVIKEALQKESPASVQFRTGLVVPSVDVKPRDPHYKLLEKAGYVKLQNATGGATRVELTALGEGTLNRFPELQKKKNTDGTVAYVVPLAKRELVTVASVRMVSPSTAVVEYTWKWAPNTVGNAFDMSGDLVQKNFNPWDRKTLVDKYGVNFYHEDPKKQVVSVVRGTKGWMISAE